MNVIYVIILVILIFVVLFRKTTTEQMINAFATIVVSRYNETLKWLNDSPFNAYAIIIYNKGMNNEFEKPDNVESVIKLNNVGREGHTYLYHIINNYEHLPDITIFLPGSIINNIYPKYDDAAKVINKLFETNYETDVFSCSPDDIKSIKDFTIDNVGTDKENQQVNSESTLSKAVFVLSVIGIKNISMIQN